MRLANMQIRMMLKIIVVNKNKEGLVALLKKNKKNNKIVVDKHMGFKYNRYRGYTSAQN